MDLVLNEQKQELGRDHVIRTTKIPPHECRLNSPYRQIHSVFIKETRLE